MVAELVILILATISIRLLISNIAMTERRENDTLLHTEQVCEQGLSYRGR